MSVRIRSLTVALQINYPSATLAMRLGYSTFGGPGSLPKRYYTPYNGFCSVACPLPPTMTSPSSHSRNYLKGYFSVTVQKEQSKTTVFHHPARSLGSFNKRMLLNCCNCRCTPRKVCTGYQLDSFCHFLNLCSPIPLVKFTS
jgi:hypothetical protein